MPQSTLDGSPGRPPNRVRNTSVAVHPNDCADHRFPVITYYRTDNMVTYRPILIAKRGELSALAVLPASHAQALQPVYQAPPREWDFGRSVFKKSLEAHLQDLPKKLATATRGDIAYIDVSLLDNVLPVFGGRHPMTWLIEEASTHGLTLAPFVGPGSAATTVAAATDAHVRLGRPVGLRLPTDDWVTVDPTRIPRLLKMIAVVPGDVDLFIDAGHGFGPLTRSGAIAELSAQDATYSFRSRTLGGAAFPDTQGIAKGLSEIDRQDWTLFREVYRHRVGAGLPAVDFFDNAINNPSVDVGLIDPRILNISAIFRYTTDGQWVVDKGDLFKGNGGRSRGAEAMVDSLTLLVAHSDYGAPIRTAADDWIDGVVARVNSGGNPEAWRKWATLRHVQVVGHQLASPI